MQNNNTIITDNLPLTGGNSSLSTPPSLPLLTETEIQLLQQQASSMDDNLLEDIGADAEAFLNQAFSASDKYGIIFAGLDNNNKDDSLTKLENSPNLPQTSTSLTTTNGVDHSNTLLNNTHKYINNVNNNSANTPNKQLQQPKQEQTANNISVNGQKELSSDDMKRELALRLKKRLENRLESVEPTTPTSSTTLDYVIDMDEYVDDPPPAHLQSSGTDPSSVLWRASSGHNHQLLSCDEHKRRHERCPMSCKNRELPRSPLQKRKPKTEDGQQTESISQTATPTPPRKLPQTFQKPTIGAVTTLSTDDSTNMGVDKQMEFIALELSKANGKGNNDDNNNNNNNNNNSDFSNKSDNEDDMVERIRSF